MATDRTAAPLFGKWPRHLRRLFRAAPLIATVAETGAPATTGTTGSTTCRPVRRWMRSSCTAAGQVGIVLGAGKARRVRNIRALVAAVVMALFTASCSPLMTDVSSLSSDAMHGRDNRQWGSTRAQNYLIGQLKTFAIGLDSSRRVTTRSSSRSRPGPTSSR